MRPPLTAVLLCGLALLLAGCGEKPAPAPAPSTPIGQQADAARAQEREGVAARDSKIMASLDALIARWKDMPAEGWESEARVLRAFYGDAKPFAFDATEARARVDAWADGRLEEARALAATATANATASATQGALDKQARIAAEAREVESRRVMQDALDKAKEEIDRQKNEVLRKTAFAIVGASLFTLLLCAAAIYFAPNKLRALGDIGPIALCAVLGLGLAQLVTRPWFATACGIVLAVGIVGAIWWGIRKNAEGKLAAALKEKAEQTAAVAAKTIPAIDATYDAMRKGAITTAEQVFTELFARQSTDMNKTEKARVHSIRAEAKAANA